jgi:hypothetical protein
MAKTHTVINQIERKGVVKDVALGKMHIMSRHAQREKINEARVDYLLANIDLEKFGMPTLSERDGRYYIIDGQHRIEMIKRFLGDGWETQTIECYVYSGLTESEEADLFLGLNNALQVSAFDKFRVSIAAGYADEVHIDAILRGAGLCISRDQVPGAVGCVTALRRVYKRSDGATLARALRIIRDAYGDPGMASIVIDGIGHLCQRYNGTLDEKTAVSRLSETRGGLNGLLGRANVLHKQTGNIKAQCVAAAAVDIINAKRGAKKLPSWWKA